MNLYWVAVINCLFCLLSYFLGGQDQANDIVKQCETRYNFTVDGTNFTCIPTTEYFKDK